MRGKGEHDNNVLCVQKEENKCIAWKGGSGVDDGLPLIMDTHQSDQLAPFICLYIPPRKQSAPHKQSHSPS